MCTTFRTALSAARAAGLRVHVTPNDILVEAPDSLLGCGRRLRASHAHPEAIRAWLLRVRSQFQPESASQHPGSSKRSSNGSSKRSSKRSSPGSYWSATGRGVSR